MLHRRGTMSQTHSRILLVEDEDIVAGFIEYTLVEHHVVVERVTTGEAAWAVLQQPNAQIQAILLDRQLPDQDGLQFLRALKEKPSLRDIPVVMETGENDPESIREGLEAGAYYYLTKPLEAKVLVAVVEAALAQRRDYRDMQTAVRHEGSALATLESGLFRFRTLTQARQLAQGLARACPEPERAVIGLQELLVNAVEHGNLGIRYADKTKLLLDGTWAAEVETRLGQPHYAQRTATITLTRDARHLTLTITDEGEGFDWSDYLQFDAKRALDPHGRGIAMARLMSFDSLEYLGKGNSVRVQIALKASAPPS